MRPSRCLRPADWPIMIFTSLARPLAPELCVKGEFLAVRNKTYWKGYIQSNRPYMIAQAMWHTVTEYLSIPINMWWRVICSGLQDPSPRGNHSNRCRSWCRGEFPLPWKDRLAVRLRVRKCPALLWGIRTSWCSGLENPSSTEHSLFSAHTVAKECGEKSRPL